MFKSVVLFTSLCLRFPIFHALTFFVSVFGKFPINTVRDSFSGSGVGVLGISVSDWSLECFCFFFLGLCPSTALDVTL